MKIIGKTGEGYITSITKEEIKSLLAINDNRREKLDINVGDDLTFTVALSNLNLLKDIQLSGNYKALGELKEAQLRLESIIKSIEKTEGNLMEVQKQIKTGQS